MANTLGFDEDQQLGIHLHLLEEMGFVQRGVDVTLKASTRLLAPADRVMARAGEMLPAALARAVGRVLAAQGINEVSRAELRVVEGATAAGVDPVALDEAFYRLALEGWLIYRAFARGYTLAPRAKAVA